MAANGITTLRVDAQVLISTAESFQGSGSTISTLVNEMVNIVVNLCSIWETDAANVFISRFRALEDDIQKMTKMIAEHVSDLQTMAQNYIKADEESANLAESLSGDVII